MTNSGRQTRRPRVALTLNELNGEFCAQLKLLKRSCEAFDAGDRDEFRRIALSIRILLYDQGQSRSLATQLGIKGITFMAYSRPVDPRNMLSENPLVFMEIGPDGAKYVPVLDQLGESPRPLTYDQWWNEEAFRSMGGIAMARSGFILHTANQAGGAHVDPEVDEEFHKIAKQNAAGWVAGFGDDVEEDLEDIEKAYVRHIGFEVLQVLEPEWTKIEASRPS